MLGDKFGWPPRTSRRWRVSAAFPCANPDGQPAPPAPHSELVRTPTDRRRRAPRQGRPRRIRGHPGRFRAPMPPRASGTSTRPTIRPGWRSSRSTHRTPMRTRSEPSLGIIGCRIRSSSTTASPAHRGITAQAFAIRDRICAVPDRSRGENPPGGQARAATRRDH